MGSPNPSFQKRQKEQKRKEKADEKRIARQNKVKEEGEGTPEDEFAGVEVLNAPTNDQD